MRKIGKTFYYILTLLTIISCNQQEDTVPVQIKKLDYPSASAVEYYDGKLYVMGDDAPNLLILDTNFTIIDSIPIVPYQGQRIPKPTKPDLEASALYKDNTGTAIFLFGSGSLSPYRNSGWFYDLVSQVKDTLSLTTLYSQIKNSGIEQVNIEGACFIDRKLLLSNRGNKSYPFNHLIYIDEALRSFIDLHPVAIPFEPQNDTASFQGISGICYAKETDQLIMTVSTEDTRSAYEDGAIGKSYLWIIDNISKKLNPSVIKPNKVIDLETIDARFKGQKIESATIIKETKDEVCLVIVADNDDGSSTIFKTNIKLH